MRVTFPNGDCNGNCIDDARDMDCNHNGIPDDCDNADKHIYVMYNYGDQTGGP